MLCYRNAEVAAGLFRIVGLEQLIYLNILECFWHCCLNQIIMAIRMPIRHFKHRLQFSKYENYMDAKMKSQASEN